MSLVAPVPTLTAGAEPAISTSSTTSTASASTNKAKSNKSNNNNNNSARRSNSSVDTSSSTVGKDSSTTAAATATAPNPTTTTATSTDASSPTTESINTTTAPSRDNALMHAIAKGAATAMVQPTVTLTVYIRSTAVGAVIGRRGQNICSLQKTAAAAAHTAQAVRVSIVGPEAAAATDSVPYTYSELDWSNAAWTPVVIRADPTAALAAAYKLQDMVQQAVDQVVMDVPISRTKHAAIVGKRGITVANLSADCNVRIMLPNKNLRHDVLQLEGDLDNVKRCLARVLQIASKAKPSNKNNSNSGGAATATDNNNSDAAPAAAVSAHMKVSVLPSQTKIRNVGRKTDCAIKKKKMDHEWQLTFTGSNVEQVQAAVAMLQKWKDDNGIGGSSASGATLATTAAAAATMQVSTDAVATAGSTSTTTAPSPSRRNNNRGRMGGRGAGGGGRGTPKRGGKNNNREAPSQQQQS